MKILTGIDVPFRPFGGSLVYSDNIYSDLPSDVEVRFLALKPPTDEHWWSIKDVVLLDIPRAKSEDEFFDHAAKLREAVLEQIAEFQPDIIHCQHLNYALSRTFVDLQNDIPKLGICHGTDVQAASKSEFFRENLVHICDRLDELLFPNQNMADDFFRFYPHNKKYVINPYAILDEYFENASSRPLFESGKRLEVLYAGRLLAWKGPDIAVEAMAHVHENIHLTVIGNEDQPGYLQGMHDFVAQHNLENKVTFQAQLSREELLSIFSKFDVIVFPSRSLEAFSLTVVEAQAKGLPLLYGGRGGGIVETVGDGGLRLEENTPEELGETLDRIYRNPQILAELKQKGFQNAQAYKLSESRKRLLDISRELIASVDRTHERS